MGKIRLSIGLHSKAIRSEFFMVKLASIHLLRRKNATYLVTFPRVKYNIRY